MPSCVTRWNPSDTWMALCSCIRQRAVGKGWERGAAGLEALGQDSQQHLGAKHAQSIVECVDKTKGSTRNAECLGLCNKKARKQTKRWTGGEGSKQGPGPWDPLKVTELFRPTELGMDSSRREPMTVRHSPAGGLIWGALWLWACLGLFC